MPTFESEARVSTTEAKRYIKRLCKHFAHEVEATFSDERGQATFPFGRCVMLAEPDVLVLRAEAKDEDEIARVEEVLEKHLEMFSRGRETLDVSWSDPANEDDVS